MEVENQAPIYSGLVGLIDHFDNQEGIQGSLRERVIRAVHQENWLLRYVATPGQKVANWVYNIAVIVGNARTNSTTHTKNSIASDNNNYLGIQDNSIRTTNQITINASKEEKKEEKEKKEENSRAGFLAILGITTLTIGSAYALFYSTSRLVEIQKAKKEVEELQTRLEGVEGESPYFSEVKACKDCLSDDFNASIDALSEQETYYKTMNFVTGLIALGVGALAYDQLYQRSLFAHRAMVTTLLASAVTFAYSLTLPNHSKKALERFETNYKERKAMTNSNSQTRYGVVKSIVASSPPSKTVQNNYSDFSNYVRYEPFSGPIWAPSAPPA